MALYCASMYHTLYLLEMQYPMIKVRCNTPVICPPTIVDRFSCYDKEK